jgi:hypothetical protein
MSENNIPVIESRLRSPRAAAIAGMIFSILLTTSVLLFRSIATVTPELIDRQGLEALSATGRDTGKTSFSRPSFLAVVY